MTGALLLLLSLHAQTVAGTVRDSANHPVSAASVLLGKLTTHTAADGSYRFEHVPAGTYTIRAEQSGAIGTATFTIGEKTVKAIDLKLQPALEFSDQPQFVVAGVTESTYQGGHGSGMAVRSAADLAKATAALSPSDVNRKDALETARQLQRAAEADPTEPNLFNWGTDLLVHHAAEQSTAVFEKGHQLHPHSIRMLLGLGASWYARSLDGQAAGCFLAAADLNPADPSPYFFLEKLSPPPEGSLQRFERFAHLQPENALANYYYAEILWKQRPGPDDTETPKRVQFLLEKSVRLDPLLASAWLLRGVVEADATRSTDAIASYQKALAADPELVEARYRLAQEYHRIGEIEKSQAEMSTYRQASRELQERQQRERAATPQFVITLRNAR